MNVFKIAWRSIQHRGLGSVLTILSMALGVMMVVAVLSIHGIVEKSFKSNNSFGYNILVGARGGGLQLTLNTVFYLSRPVENIPYEYYLAFCDPETRNRELKNSIAFQTEQHIANTTDLTSPPLPGGFGFGSAISDALLADSFEQQQFAAMKIEKPGLYKRYTHMAIPICLGDSYVDPETGLDFKCVGTKPHFFTDLLLDIDTEKKFEFAQGRAFVEDSEEHGLFECVVGAITASRCNIQLGDRLQATHDFDTDSAHLHEQEYTVVGILAPTLTPHDRVVFLNMEGFYLMEDHAMALKNTAVLKTGDDEDEDAAPPIENDSWLDDDDDAPIEPLDDSWNEKPSKEKTGNSPSSAPDPLTTSEEFIRKQNATRIPLPIEQREVTSILIRTSLNDEVIIGFFLPDQINEGDLETTLDWSPYRPDRSQKAAQAVNPVIEVASLFELFVDPIRWLLLGLTTMICVVSALSILVGIYNSMSQRQHEIAVMRALGANRSKVMMIMLCEAVMLALVGGLIGWAAGHGLNSALSPFVESRTGVAIGFFDFAPAVPLASLPGAGLFPESLTRLGVSPEFMLIPGLILLAILVGIYPAISAYKTDVSKSLGK